MAKLLKLRRGTTTQHGSFTGAEGEVTIDTTKDTAVVHDGSTAGGRPLLREDMSNLPAGTIDNADVNASAAISGTKISPDFGSQDITTTGKIKFANVYSTEGDLPSASTYHGMFAHVHGTGHAYFAHGGSWHKLANISGADFTGDITTTGNITTTGGFLEVRGTQPQLRLNDTNHENDYEIQNSDGTFAIRDIDANADRITIAADGTTRFKASSVVAEQGFNCQGNLVVSGTVDGRDVASDGSKLDGIESGATGDQTNAEIAAALSDQRPSMKGATFTDDGTGSPIVKIRADDTSPWGLQVANDSYWNNDSNGWKIYQDNSGNVDNRVTGNGAWVNWYFKTQNSGNSETIIHVDTNRAVHLAYRGSNKLGTTSSGVSVTGDMTASGNVTAYSDARLKTDVNTINDALGIVGKLRGVSYKWIATDQPSIGVIAQEVEEVIPEVVLTTRETNPSTGETTEIKSVDYGKIVGVLINAINELKAELDEHKKQCPGPKTKKNGGK